MDVQNPMFFLMLTSIQVFVSLGLSAIFSFLAYNPDWFSFPQKSPTQVKKKGEDEKKGDDTRNGSTATGHNRNPFGRLSKRKNKDVERGIAE